MKKWSYWLRVPCCALIVGLNLAPLGPSYTPVASAQTATDSPLQRAIDLTDLGQNEQVVQLLRPLVDADSLPRADRPTALNLLGKSYVRLEAPASADTMFYLLARARPSWVPTISGYSEEELTAARAGYERAHLQKKGILKGLVTFRRPWWKDVKTYVYLTAAGTAVYLVTRDKKGSTTNPDDKPNPEDKPDPLPTPPLPPSP
jgi:hypothetical protein